MISGAHVVLHSRDAQADRAFLRDVLGFPHVDAGHGWLIFALPPAEIAVHPTEGAQTHEFFLICDDLEEAMARLSAAGIALSPVETPRWGRLVRLTLPSGTTVGLYEPHHPRP